MKLRNYGIDCSGQCLKAAHHDGVCSCVCGGVNHAAIIVAGQHGVDVREVLGSCHGKPLSENRSAYVLPPPPFAIGQRVKFSREAYHHFNYYAPDEHYEKWPRFGYVYGGSAYVAYLHHGVGAHLRVIKEGTGTPTSYSPNFWEAL